MAFSFGRTTYSLSEVSATIQNPLVGQKVINGTGVGTITWAYTDDLSQSDLGADGFDMVSKIVSHRGTITIELQQTSASNTWLRNYFNRAENASGDWANGTITVKETFSNGAVMTATNVSPLKRPDHKDDMNGGRLSWTFHSANITES